MTQVKAQDLKVGDKIAFTNDLVIESPYRGLNTPNGKVSLTVTTAKGHKVAKVWNKMTIITIL